MNQWLPLAFGVLLLNGTVLTLQNLLPVKYTRHFLSSAFLVLVTLISVTIFNERLGPRGVLAAIVGIASAIVLKLS